jgi:hypothetical protein
MRLSSTRCQVETVRSSERRFMAVSTQRLCGGTVLCRGVRRPANCCTDCPHRVDEIRSAGSTVAIRCLYLETDTVADVMTAVDHLRVLDESEPVVSARGADPAVVTAGGDAIGVVARTARLGVIAEAMATHETPAIVVMDGEEMVGVVTRDDLCRLAIV